MVEQRRQLGDAEISQFEGRGAGGCRQVTPERQAIGLRQAQVQRVAFMRTQLLGLRGRPGSRESFDPGGAHEVLARRASAEPAPARSVSGADDLRELTARR